MGIFSQLLSRESGRLLFGVALPLTTAFVILVIDHLEGPRVAFAGIAAAVGFLTANFYGPRITALISVLVVSGVYVFGLSSEDAGTGRQNIRIFLIVAMGLFAVLSSVIRGKTESERNRFSRLATEFESTSKLALVDEMTGIYNRRGVIEALSADSRWPRSVAILDLDKLKSINDKFGHDSGDHFIQVIARRIQGSVSASDIVGRWGGDEFIIILPLSETQALSVINRVITQISKEPIVSGDMDVIPGISAGVSEWSKRQTLERALHLADSALYQAKRSGGNQSIAASVALQN